MRFVRGRTLAEAAAAHHERLARNEVNPSELRELIGAFAGVCNAVAYAQSRRPAPGLKAAERRTGGLWGSHRSGLGVSPAHGSTGAR